MTLWILLALALYYAYLFLPSLFLVPRMGLGAYMSSRDSEPEPAQAHGRAIRAHRNYLENLPVFVTLALLAMIVPQADMALATTGAAIFVIARAAYLPLYLLAVPMIRSLVWMASFVGLIMIAVSLF